MAASTCNPFPSPTSTVVDILAHILSDRPSLAQVPLSQPVLLRLQWITPESDTESFLYFNNMTGQGASGRVEELRKQLTHLGPSAWEVCAPDQVEYKADEECTEDDGLTEIFARVTVWATKYDGTNVSDGDKLAIILKLERGEPNGLPEPDAVELCWKYFDLQDLITPGLDTRPWFGSVKAAFAASKRSPRSPIDVGWTQPGEPYAVDEKDEQDYWAGYSSGSAAYDPPAHPPSPLPSSLPPDLQDRIRHTPLYRHRAPSVSSASAEPVTVCLAPSTPQPNSGPTDLLARISRTPLYQRHAPSVASSAASAGGPAKINVTELLEAAGVANLPTPLQQAAARALLHTAAGDGGRPMRKDTGTSRPLDEAIQTLHAGLPEAPPSLFPPSRPEAPLGKVEEMLLNALKASYQLYRHALAADRSMPSSLSPGERFVALAHRAALLDDQQGQS